jgi:hypothetical protein
LQQARVKGMGWASVVGDEKANFHPFPPSNPLLQVAGLQL